jgi:hypothetical protein
VANRFSKAARELQLAFLKPLENLKKIKIPQ